MLVNFETNLKKAIYKHDCTAGGGVYYKHEISTLWNIFDHAH